jgi:hypothetical protein
MFTHYIKGIETSTVDCGWFNKFVQKKKLSNAFENVPYSDEVNGLLRSVPVKMLHVSGTGLQKHMFGCFVGPKGHYP